MNQATPTDGSILTSTGPLIDPSHPWACFLTAVWGHMLFDPRGRPLIRVQKIETHPPKWGSPAEAIAEEESWAVELRIHLEALQPIPNPRTTIRLPLPIYTCRQTLVIRGRERVPSLSPRELDADLARRTHEWLETHRQALTSDVLRRRKQWQKDKYVTGFNRTVFECFHTCLIQGRPPGKNRLAHQISLQKDRWTPSPVIIPAETETVLRDALPLTSTHASLPPWAPRELGQPLHSPPNSGWAAHEDQLPTLKVRAQSQADLPAGSLFLSYRALDQLQTSIPRRDTERASTEASDLPVIGDPMALIDSNGKCTFHRLSGTLYEDTGPQALTSSDTDFEAGTAWLVRIRETRSPRARLRDIPERVLASDGLAEQILARPLPPMHGIEWGARWQSVRSPEDLSRARQLQSFLAPLGLAMGLDQGGVRLVAVHAQDLEAVATRVEDLARRVPRRHFRHPHKYGHGGMGGRRGYVKLRSNGFPLPRQQEMRVLGVPDASLLWEDDAKTHTPLGEVYLELGRCLEREFRRWSAHAILRTHQTCLEQIFQETCRELESIFALEEELPETGFTPVLAHPELRPDIAEVSLDLFDALSGPKPAEQLGGTPILLVGDQSMVLRLKVGEGRSCVRVHPSICRRLGQPEVFSVVPKTDAAREAASSLQRVVPQEPGESWLTELIGTPATLLSERLEEILETGLVSPVDHPSSRRVLGWLDDRVRCFPPDRRWNPCSTSMT